MAGQTPHQPRPATDAGGGAPVGQRLSVLLWVALAGAILQLMGLGSSFYAVPGEGGETRKVDAWFAIPHTSDLVLLSAVVAIVFFFLVARDRSPVRGRGVGLWIGIVGSLAFLQLGYRMLAPPFNFEVTGNQTLSQLWSGSCLFYCGFAEAAEANATLLAGIWFSFAGTVLVAVAGLGYAFSKAGTDSSARPWVAAVQTGRDPWLALAAVGAVAAFVIGYTFFPFYNTGDVVWSGWLPTPHTSSLVLLLAVAVVWLVVLAARGRAPLSPAALGGTIAILGFVMASRILLRILQPPFGSGPATIEPPAYVSFGAAVLVVVAGIAFAAAQRPEGMLARRPDAEPTPTR